MVSIAPPYLRGLVLLRHRLAAPQIAENLLRVYQVAKASARLPQRPLEAQQSVSGQAEPPEATTSEGSSTTNEMRSSSWSRTA